MLYLKIVKMQEKIQPRKPRQLEIDAILQVGFDRIIFFKKNAAARNFQIKSWMGYSNILIGPGWMGFSSLNILRLIYST